MKKILSIIPIILLFHSCDNKVYFDIPQNEKPLLTNNDTICFFCNKGNSIDTFIVKITDVYEISDKKYYHEKITISFQKLKETSYFKKIYVQQGEDATNISIDGYYFPTIYKNENIINLDVGGITYISVYLKQDNNFPDTIPHVIYYSHTHGILRYDYSDSIYFEMKNK